MSATTTITAPATPPPPIHRHELVAGMAGLAGHSPAMRAVCRQVARLADSDVPVLITGETGTGKELVAKALHRESVRAARPFVDVNCGALPESLALSELFGHKKGAFTGADRQRAGVFERAAGGTLFLDEVGDLSFRLQAALLRVLETGYVCRLGGQGNVPCAFRLVCATHRDLGAEVRAGRFREDLYYRVAVVLVDVPPLRERPGDIADIAAELLRRMGEDRVRTLTAEALCLLRRHTWPGNVRELRNVLRRAAALADGPEIGPGDLGLGGGGVARSLARNRPAADRVSDHFVDHVAEGSDGAGWVRWRGRLWADVQRDVWAEAVRTAGSMAAAARSLGVPKQTLGDFCGREGLVPGGGYREGGEG